MFDEVDKQLAAWATSNSSGLEISFRSPEAETDKLRLYLYLLDVFPVPAGRGTVLPPIQMTLRYLIVPQGAEAAETHSILGKLMIAAMENSEFEVEKAPLPFEVWRAFGIAPQPSILLRVPFKYERTEKLAPPVRYPLTVKQTILETLQGRISVNQIPMMDAKVEIPKLKLFTKTDAEGNFNFASLPSVPSNKDLVIRVKGREFSVSTSQAERRGNRFLFELKLEE